MTKVDDTSVRVAVRLRPQNSKEKAQMNEICTQVDLESSQIFIGKDKCFTFDYVFNIDSTQESLFLNLSKSLIDGCLEGYNATVFAYGQTGSGKTYTMGTGMDYGLTNDELGIIPRAVQHLFTSIDKIKENAQTNGLPQPTFKVMAQFLELYNEELYDLLEMSESKESKSHIRIHEDAKGEIYLTNVSSRVVSSFNETIQCLKDGALGRSTASTLMNTQSSRSHAIFTLHIKQSRIIHNNTGDKRDGEDEGEEDDDGGGVSPTEMGGADVEILSAKFHFVDLAGSERLKRTGATGARAKEGIAINCGLLALGNVISALGDRNKRGWHVPYRDSKLTRLLQDSLGGNSRTIMIACVSPSDCDFLETLNTLEYANRARNIKNKVSINQDKGSKQVAALRAQISQLQAELLEYKTGRRMVGDDGTEIYSDLFTENSLLQTENNKLRVRIKALSECVDSLRARNCQLSTTQDLSGVDLNELSSGTIEENNSAIRALVAKYNNELETLRTKLYESEAMVAQLERSQSQASGRAFNTQSSNHSSSNRLDNNSSTGNLLRQSSSNVMTQSFCATSSSDTKGDPMTESCMEPYPSDSDDCHESDNDTNSETFILESLANLDDKIDERERLIKELQGKAKQLDNIRRQYEAELHRLHGRIKTTEKERDEILSNIGEVEHSTEEKVKKVKEEYEEKIRSLRNELMKVSQAVKENNRRQREQERLEKEKDKLQQELASLKRMKVELARKLREESKRNRETELMRNREIANLRKAKLQADNQIRNLENEKQRRENVLRRKQEEVELLRRRHVNVSRPNMTSTPKPRVMSSSVTLSNRLMSGQNESMTQQQQQQRTTMPHRRRNSVLARQAKVKWEQLAQALNSLARRRNMQTRFQKDLNNWMRERKKLGKQIATLTQTNTSSEEAMEVESKLRNLKGQLESVQEQISECQANILEIGEEGPTDSLVATVLAQCSLGEAHYLLNHLFEEAIQRSVLAEKKSQIAGHLRQQLTSKSKEMKQAVEIAITRMPQLKLDFESLFPLDESSDEDEEVEDEDSNADSLDEGEGESCDNNNLLLYDVRSPVGNYLTSPPLSMLSPTSPLPDHRRSSKSPNPVHSVNSESPDPPHPHPPPTTTTIVNNKVSPVTPNNDNNGAAGVGKWATPVFNRMTISMDESQFRLSPQKISRPISKTNGTMSRGGGTVTLGRRRGAAVAAAIVCPSGIPLSPRGSQQRRTPPTFDEAMMAAAARGSTLPRRRPPPPEVVKDLLNTPNALMTQSMYVPNVTPSEVNPPLSPHPMGGGGGVGITPPSSPPQKSSFFIKRPSINADENVFNRLSNTSRASPVPFKGQIVATTNRRSLPLKTNVLECSHVVEGHTKAVLDICLADNIMLTASKDRTAKVWDLRGMCEVTTLPPHVNNVVRVHYLPSTHQYFTVCSYFVHVWDERDLDRPVMTLLSSGLTETEVGVNSRLTSRQNICPPGETSINDVHVDGNGIHLFMATGISVRMWDLRRGMSLAKLHGNHQAPVMALAYGADPHDATQRRLLTGSKDHFIKMFRLSPSSSGIIMPSAELQPPHYDGIESLALLNNTLFSGSRDACIKKWDLSSNQQPREIYSLPQAHRDWIQSLCVTTDGQTLISACRGGTIKLWNVDDGSLLGDVNTQSSINAVKTHNILIATASNDNVVRLWKRCND